MRSLRNFDAPFVDFVASKLQKKDKRFKNPISK
jgi:hypothetical protein